MMWVLLVCAIICSLAFPNRGDTQTFSIYETPLKIQSDGFPAETHHVTTVDGYILEMHRIPHGSYIQDMSSDRPVIFLMHGLLAASNAYIALGSEKSIAYNLADAGFDVWMGNARGTKNSRHHVSMDPDNETLAFFDFTWEDIGLYDLPAMIDYILTYTGREKLHYIGHSQGGTVFLVLNSMIPEYNEKFLSAHLLAGVGYKEHFPNTELRILAATTDIIYGIATSLGVVELFPPNATNMIDLPGFGSDYQKSDFCTGDIQTSYICEAVGVRHIMRNDAVIGIQFDDYEPGGASLKQVAHYGQNIRDRQFRRYHHGIFGNMGIYGSITPPAYNLSLITAKVTMHYTVNDNLLDERDVLAMANDMPNTEVRKVARETFLHEDFIAAEDVKELVTEYIIEAIKIESGWSGPELDINNIDDDNAEDIEPVPEPVALEPVSDSASTVNIGLYLIITDFLILLR